MDFRQNESLKVQAKLKHVSACLVPESAYQKSAGFESVGLSHEAAASLSLNEISLKTSFLGHDLKAPLMIAPMTGGMELGAVLNERWAKAAEHFGLALGVGSQRLALDDAQVAPSFMVRKWAKSALIFANLGAAQLLNADGPSRALRAVRMIDANAFFIHINPLQEACQEGGDVNFVNLLPAIEKIVLALSRENIPVLVREVGFGLSQKSAAAFLRTGIAGLDCAGAGGTSWTKVEGLVAHQEKYRRLGEVFGEWGISTVQSIKNVRAVHRDVPLIATGGIRSGLDIAKCVALGANLASMAQPMLQAAILGEDELFSFVEGILFELRVAMFANGAKTVGEITLD